jgi:hypothetical protein
MKWQPGTGPSAKYFIVSDCMGWCICKSGEPPVYTLAKLGGKVAELVMSGSLEKCKREADKQNRP